MLMLGFKGLNLTSALVKDPPCLGIGFDIEAPPM